MMKCHHKTRKQKSQISHSLLFSLSTLHSRHIMQDHRRIEWWKKSFKIIFIISRSWISSTLVSVGMKSIYLIRLLLLLLTDVDAFSHNMTRLAQWRTGFFFIKIYKIDWINARDCRVTHWLGIYRYSIREDRLFEKRWFDSSAVMMSRVVNRLALHHHHDRSTDAFPLLSSLQNFDWHNLMVNL